MATIQDIMQDPVLVLTSENTVGQAIVAIRAIPRNRLYTYPANDAAGSSESIR
jgi:hypothetical protein